MEREDEINMHSPRLISIEVLKTLKPMMRKPTKATFCIWRHAHAVSNKTRSCTFQVIGWEIKGNE